MRIDSWDCFQECQGRHYIIELIRGEQDKLQMLTRLFSSRLLFLPQHILHEWRLAGGWTVSTTKWIQKRVPVLNEKRCQCIGCLGNRHPGRVVSIGSS